MGTLIQGDGNAVGNGNQIIVNKNTVVNNNGGSSNNNDEELPAGLAIGGAVLVALAVAVWKFAQFAPVIYLSLEITAMGIISIQLLTAIAMYRNQPTAWMIDHTMGVVATGIVMVGVVLSATDYRAELTDIALHANRWRDFMCGLSTYGAQLASFHTLSMSLLAIPALMITLINAMGASARWLAYRTGSRFAARLATIQTRRAAIVASVFAILCAISQLDISKAAWADWFTTHVEAFFHYIC